MRAVKTTKYGPPEVLQIVETDSPVPKSNEVLIQIRAIAVTSGDCRMRAFNPPYWYFRIPMRLMLGICKPRRPIQGLWLSGVIKKTGTEVEKYETGQQIYARTPNLKFGANAEYICLPQDSVMALKPNNLSYEEAVSVPFGAISALHFLRKAKIKKNDILLVYGASGAVGIAAVQLGKYFGAQVHAVCSTANIELVKNNGADSVIDYKKQNVENLRLNYDIVFDAVGKINKSIGKKILNEKGRYISVISSGHAQGGIDELKYMTELAEKGFIKPVVDRVYAFEQIVEAHRYVDTGHKKGNVVLAVR